MRLFHFTCDHSRIKILADLTLKPSPVGLGLLWLTDLATPSAEELGLTSYMLRCDRLAYVMEVETDQATPWTYWAHSHHVKSDIRFILDGSPGARPGHWWVSETEISVLSIQPYRKAAFTRDIGA
jgi:hypothetical protein